MSDDGSSSPSPDSSAASTSLSAISGPSSSSPTALHAQAVRFLTSLRHRSPSASLESQREFLKSKGLDEDAIQAALKDADRPSSLTQIDPSDVASTSANSLRPPPGDASTEDDEEAAAFQQASRAFEDPIHVPGPVLPAKNYPRSPLALYYEEAQQRIKEDESARRYQVLLSFFRTMSWLLTLGGGFTALSVFIYRLYIMPKIVKTLDARSHLLQHHHSLWDQLVGSIQSLRGTSLAPVEKREQVDKKVAILEGGGKQPKKVQFADEIHGGQLEQREGEDTPLLSSSKSEEKAGVVPGTDVVVAKKTSSSDDKEGDEGESTSDDGRRIELEPIDITEPLRNSLAALSQKLRGVDGQSSTSTPASSTSMSAATTTTVQDGSDEDLSSGSSNDSWQDYSDEELELDLSQPSSSSSTKKGSKKSKKTTQSGAPSSSLDSKKTSSTAPSEAANTATSNQPNESSRASSALYTSLTDLNNSMQARYFQSQTRQAFKFGGAGGAYGNFSFGKSGSSGKGAGEQPKEQMDEASEIAGQIKAEIRSLKGLLLSRKNFPRPGSAGIGGGSSGTSTPIQAA